MRRSTASIAFGVLMLASLAAKSSILAPLNVVEPEIQSDAIVRLLNERGFAVTFSEAGVYPAWTLGERGTCRIGIAEVSPQGWYRAVIGEQAGGQRLNYAFAGQFYDEQPVARTKIEDYRRRLLRYFRPATPPTRVRAVVIAPACPDDVIRAEDAELLSR